MATQHAATFGRRTRSELAFAIVAIIAAVLIGIALFVGLVYIFSDEVGMPVVVTSDADGTSMSMVTDAEVLIVLDSNATTGYEWAVDAYDAGVVEFVGSTYVEPENGAVGQGGTQELQFRAINEGTTVVSLKYWRPWEGEASVAERFEMTLEVRD